MNGVVRTNEEDMLPCNALNIIADVFHIQPDGIVDICALSKGMTNRSFRFSVNGDKYIIRIPGEGTDQLINRRQEAEVYRTIDGYGLCDTPVFLDPETGFKISKYLSGVRSCDPKNIRDLEHCMKKLHQLHGLKLSVHHAFDIFEKIDYYESLRGAYPSIYQDYSDTKENVWKLKPFIDGLDKDWCLTHIDAVPDNFLFYRKEDGEVLQLTDWEYSGMQDPHVDIAMFCIYSLYNKQQVDSLIDIYFDSNCNKITRAKIYAYIAMSGLLWSNWCEFKSIYGIKFGAYAFQQYQFAKDYYYHSLKEIGM